MKYDKAQDNSGKSYSAFVEWLEDRTAAELQQANGKKKDIKAAIAKYLETGYRAHLTWGELLDFFCVDTPCVLHKAGFSEKEMDKAIEIYDKMNPEYFARFFHDD